MGLEIVEPNSCIRGCCCSDSIPLHLPTSAYTLLSPIARGAESVVYEAILNGAKVAVKKPILSTSEHIDKFHKELQLLCTLNHPGISRLVAAHAKPPNYMFFFQLFQYGSLAQKLHAEEWNPNIRQALLIAIHLSKALQYLHDLGIVHRDVKPANMLLDENLYPHLADFGLAEFKKNLAQVTVENWRSSGKPTGGFHKKNMVGTLIYMAPEVLKKEVHTEKSDVYSFGISINELLTGVVPYTDLRAEAQAHTVLEMNYTEQQLTAAVVSGKLRPALATSESGASPCLLSLIQRCWDDNPDRRPSFSDILLELDTMIGQKLVLEKYIDHTEKSTRNNQEAINWSHQGERVVKRTSFAGNSGLSSWFDSSTSFVEYYPVLSCGSFASRGRRETMEDTHFMMPNFCNEKSIHAFGIFDGHRGGAAAEFSAKALPGYLHNLGLTRSPIDALTKSFIETDVAFKNELDSHRSSRRITQKNWHPGCTAIASLIVGNRLFVANAGDCRAMLCRAGNAFPLTEDHIASNLKERERVVSAGGEVKWQVDTWRVGSAALQVTRSIGDDDLKPAVTAEPEVTETILTEEDEFLVMASDGLWDCVRNAEVVSIIRDTVKEPTMCSKRLATEAAERGSNDNITVIVVFLRPVSTAERVY
ncbi:Protein kinase and PP2C-like domain-containing protein [Linum perenne]